MDSLNDVELWVALSRTKGLGSVTLCQLLKRFRSPEGIYSATSHELCEIVDLKLAQTLQRGPDAEDISATLSWLSQEGNALITLADDTYPKPLLEITNPPAILYAKGQLSLLKNPGLAIVGSRHASVQGEKNAEDFAENLSNKGLTIISGLALGIDGAAHRGALKGEGRTIAVVGTGLDIIYPARHKSLAHQIAKQGLLLSEFPLGTPSMAQNFPRRNRIISGLALGCLVIEANLDSGSLITARLASEQGRDVFAIPGSIHSPLSKGCHHLIKQGAKLVESVEDVLSELSTFLPTKTPSADSPIGPLPERANNHSEASPLLGLMGYDPIDFDTLLTQSDLTAEALSTMLSLLEIEGEIYRLPGGQFQRLH